MEDGAVDIVIKETLLQRPRCGGSEDTEKEWPIAPADDESVSRHIVPEGPCYRPEDDED
jgi:hypothetical protein